MEFARGIKDFPFGGWVTVRENKKPDRMKKEEGERKECDEERGGQSALVYSQRSRKSGLNGFAEKEKKEELD